MVLKASDFFFLVDNFFKNFLLFGWVFFFFLFYNINVIKIHLSLGIFQSFLKHTFAICLFVHLLCIFVITL